MSVRRCRRKEPSSESIAWEALPSQAPGPQDTCRVAVEEGERASHDSFRRRGLVSGDRWLLRTGWHPPSSKGQDLGAQDANALAILCVDRTIGRLRRPSTGDCAATTMGTGLSPAPFRCLMLPGIGVGTRLPQGWAPDHPGNSERTDLGSVPVEQDTAVMPWSELRETLDQGIKVRILPRQPTSPQNSTASRCLGDRPVTLNSVAVWPTRPARLPGRRHSDANDSDARPRS